MNELTQFLMSHGGPVLFAIVFVEQAGLPLPSAPWLLAAGALSATGKLNPVLALAMTALACVVADSIWFYVGRRGGQRVLHLFCRLSLALVRATRSASTRRREVHPRVGRSNAAARRCFGHLYRSFSIARRLGLVVLRRLLYRCWAVVPQPTPRHSGDGGPTRIQCLIVGLGPGSRIYRFQICPETPTSNRTNSAPNRRGTRSRDD